jgi:hypothetical protein
MYNPDGFAAFQMGIDDDHLDWTRQGLSNAGNWHDGNMESPDEI